MKRIAALILAGGVISAPAHAGTFENESRKMDKAFQLQDQLFAAEKQSQDEAYKTYQAEMDRAWKRYTSEIEAVWGGDSKVPSKKEWVTYSKKRDERGSIDFKSGNLKVELQLKPGESPDSERVKARLKQQLADLFTKPAQEDPALKVPPPPPQSAATGSPSTPIYPLKNQVAFPGGGMVTRKNADAFADEEVNSQPLQHQEIDTPEGRKQVVSLSVALVPNHLRRRARPYLEQAHEMSQRFGIPVSLILGVMQTESYFNPMARSGVPAFGLMQLVPSSGARDAYRYVHNDDKVVSADYLYNADNNIELGSAYLKLLETREMRHIRNAKSRLFCAIAAYNTGGGNVARAFVGTTDINRASAMINRMTPEEVYEHLRSHLPYAETQQYVKRVRDHMRNYENLDD